MITLIALLLFAGLFLGLLILTIVLAATAKTTAGRVGAIIGGFVVLVGVPLFLIALTWTTTETRGPSGYPAPADQIALDSDQVVVTSPATPATPERVVPPAVVIETESPLPSAVGGSGGTWRSSEMEAFQANVYPSYAAAIKPFLGTLRETLIADQAIAVDEKNELISPKTIIVTVLGSGIEPLVSQITERISEQFPGVVVQSAGQVPPEPAENQMSVHLVVSKASQQSAPWNDAEQIENGVLTCRVQLAAWKTSFECFVTEKPWLESLDQFVSIYPKRRFVVGYSGELQSSEGQARKAALADATQQAAITLEGKLYAIIDERHVVDRFAQRLSRSYGEVWREAVLVELPDSHQVNAARMDAADAFRRSTMGKVSRHAGIAILVIATILLCLLLNWVTKGYYRNQVLIGLMGVVIVGLLIAVMFVA